MEKRFRIRLLLEHQLKEPCCSHGHCTIQLLCCWILQLLVFLGSVFFSSLKPCHCKLTKCPFNQKWYSHSLSMVSILTWLTWTYCKTQFTVRYKTGRVCLTWLQMSKYTDDLVRWPVALEDRWNLFFDKHQLFFKTNKQTNALKHIPPKCRTYLSTDHI